MKTVLRRILLPAGILLLASGCAAMKKTGPQEDALAILQASHAEERFNTVLQELAQRQVEQSPELRPLLGEIQGYWHDQVRWPDVRDRLAADYAKTYTPAELHALRRALGGPLGERLVAHTDVLNRELTRETMTDVQARLPLVEKHLASMQNAIVAGEPGTVTPEQDFSAVRARAEAGDAASQLLLAEKLLGGIGTSRDPVQAMSWLQKSSAQRHAPAEDLLATFYYRGTGVPRDYRRARELFELGAASGYLPAINDLAWMLSTCPDASLRDGKRALALITPVMDQSVQMLDTLAAAHAEAGHFDEAIELQRESIAGIGMTADPRFGDALDRLQRYAAGKAWRDPQELPAGKDGP